MNTYFKFYAVILISFLCFGCELDDSLPQNFPSSNEVVDTTANLDQFFGQEVTRSFFGEVVDTDNIPIPWALIEIGGQQVRTDVHGIFSLRDVSTHEKFSYLKVSALGYVTSGRSLRPSEGVNRVKVMLFDDSPTTNIQSGEEALVNLPNGASILFTGAYIDTNGDPYTGSVNVIMNYLDPLDARINDMMPGMLYGQDRLGDEAALETYGMISVELRGGGEKINIDPNTPAEITFPVPSSLHGPAPDIIPLWSFDEEAGYWIEEGSAVFNGTSYIAEVTHFSFWNCDAPFRVVDFCIRVTDENGNPLSNVTVVLSSSNSTTQRQGVTDGNGEVCGKVPAGFSLDLSIENDCGVLIYESVVGPFNQETAINVTTSLPPEDYGVFTILGTALNCNLELVTNGYLILYLGDETQYVSISNGMIDQVIFNCPSIDSFSYEIIDVDAFLSSGEINSDITLPVTDIGTIEVCTPSQEFISYTISGEEPVYIAFEIEATASESSNGYSILAGVNGDYVFNFYSSDRVLGTYNFSFFDAFDGVYFEELQANFTVPNTLAFELTAFGEVGEYIEVQISGEYTSISGALKSVTGEIKVIRDN